jgi:hypothetical protein
VQRASTAQPEDRRDHLIFFRCGKLEDPVDASHGFFFGPVQAEGWIA